MEESFNIFKILEKDDKELIHSSFLRFLLTENNIFYEKMLGIKNTEFNLPILEQPYTIPKKGGEKKSKRKRIDIEIRSKDQKQIIVIENKFKSFPYKEQLISYDEIYRDKHKGKIIHKFLFCFDKSLISFETDWKKFDYQDLLSFVKENYFDNVNPEKKLFINHYYEFLTEYYSKYKLVNINSKELFLNSSDAKNKFWIGLIYSSLHLSLEKFFEDNKISVKIEVNRGTKESLINIIPNHWKISGKELLIQFQGNDMKFYTHSDDKSFLKIFIQKSRENLPDEKIELKRITKSNSGTNYIFKIKLTDKIEDDKKFDLKTITHVVLDLYRLIDDKLINNKEKYLN
jgi:hypothetical protein